MRALILAAALVVAACGGAPASVAPSVAPSPAAAPSVAATASATATPSQAAVEDPIAHIERRASELLSFSTNEEIEAWIEAESDWTETQSVTAVVRAYLIVIARALIEVIYADEGEDLRVYALELYEKIGDIPGVSLP